MSFKLEERAENLRYLLSKPEVQEAMKERCLETEHDFENCCSALFQIYKKCKWCGQIS